ncbi:hypothetical protein SAMN05216551_105294 [Chitinasiproducens palmae]|uniref:Uncharacterized protein n=1 Tax=Chitinasiproducens palmae TaxID=1770053 RepID=A0A1H2PPK0_9BURK|nr:hypothetical protein SAMN05216551_105294 [Chitinasiproducens palmae]
MNHNTPPDDGRPLADLIRELREHREFVPRHELELLDHVADFAARNEVTAVPASARYAVLALHARFVRSASDTAS